MKKIIILIFVIVIVAVASFGLWKWQENKYSKDALMLEILGPSSVQAGEEVEYLVRFKNNGTARLESAELVFDYPEHSLPLEGNPERVIQNLDDIYPGEEKVIGFKALLLGKESETLTAEALINYKPKNIKARYERETSFITKIKFVPLVLDFDLPLKVEQGEKIDFSLRYSSNINYTLNNLRARIEYPNGFTFLDASPSALDEKDWDLPQVSYASGGKIEIEGVLEGDEGARKMFKAQLGIIMDNEFVLLKEASHSIEIVEPSLYISQMINSSQNYSAVPGELLHYEIFFKNIGRQPIQRKFLFVKLESDLFDLSSLMSENGEVGMGDNSIIWDWKVVSDLRFLDAGDEGKVEFWVRVKDAVEAQERGENLMLRTRATLGGTQKIFETKLSSALSLEQKVYFNDEMFGNLGPIPPIVGETTTYTVLWQVKNFWNALENVKVKTILPENVSVTGKFFPEDAKFTFDSQSREVMWNIGELEPFYGFKDDGIPLTLAFQIQFTPDSSQKGETPMLIGKAETQANDVFTSEVIEQEFEGDNTTLPDDTAISEEQGIVQ